MATITTTTLGYCLLMTLSWQCVFGTKESAGENKLRKQILTGYQDVGLRGRPVNNVSDMMAVKMSFGLIELQEFDILNQELVIVGWTALEWSDIFLQWSPEEFDGAEQLSLEVDQIWTPDVILTNALSKPEPIHKSRLHVSYDGTVTWVRTFKYHFFCKIATDDMDADTFPCFMKFASWSMGAKVFDMENKRDRFDANYYVPNREWEFYKNRAKRQEVELPWANGMKSAQVLYDFTLKRRIQKDDNEELESSASAVTSSLLTVLLVGVYKLTV